MLHANKCVLLYTELSILNTLQKFVMCGFLKVKSTKQKPLRIFNLVTFNINVHKISSCYFISQVIIKLNTNKISVDKILAYTMHNKLKLTLVETKLTFICSWREKA